MEALRGKRDGLRWDTDSFCYNPQELPQPRRKGKCEVFTAAWTRIAKLDTGQTDDENHTKYLATWEGFSNVHSEKGGTATTRPISKALSNMEKTYHQTLSGACRVHVD